MPVSWLKNILNMARTTAAAPAYDLWASAYDKQPGNLMMDLDEEVFNQLIGGTTLAGKTIVDVGCGTGRHWARIRQDKPARLVGYDISPKMLNKLKEKFFTAETYVSSGYMMPEIKDQSVDILLSTLTIAHIEKFEKAFTEWDRTMKPHGEIILTDYHPEALARGAKRTFLHKGQLISIKNYVHSTNKIRLIARQLGYEEIRFMEKYIDESVRPYYEKQNALHLFEQFRNTPIIYGIHLKKTNDPA